MKKLKALIKTAGKTKEQITEEAIATFRKLGMLKEERDLSKFDNDGKLFEERDIPGAFYLHESDPSGEYIFTREQTDQVNEWVKKHPERDLWPLIYDV